MNGNTVFVLGLGGALYSLLFWGFRKLPAETWQIAACIPGNRMADGRWSGLNLTWYGFFTATAYVLAVAVMLVLMASVGVTPPLTVCMVLAVLIVCVPASRMIATWVEGKRHTFTVGGASFVGMLAAPWVVLMAGAGSERLLGRPVDVMAVLAAMSISYALGEGIGRLACISFGCCYGRPLSDVPPLVRKILGPFRFTFRGETKKIAYAHGLEGCPVVPVQGMTSLLYTTAGLIGILLFLDGHGTAAFLLTLSVTQVWRVLSEFLRADYRGGQSFSAYQVMALAGVCYGLCLAFLFAAEAPPGRADILAGLEALWQPSMILFLQALWTVLMVLTGRSSVTASHISIHVLKDRI
ncbi:MAG TPA: prolipoprotein diacylglyceryl transferase [Syntrophales bacterium]|jgi:prolipoprotein diacylglyceryltransferase|nr:prolipoprotein diacylglyceryl transferase [Syntrophales bacterium]